MVDILVLVLEAGENACHPSIRERAEGNAGFGTMLRM
jgi:hypothetical protein